MRFSGIIASTLIILLFISGCATYTTNIYEKPSIREESEFDNWFKNTFIYQAQQLFDIERDIRVLIGKRKEASNVDENGQIPDSPLFTNRDVRKMTIEEIVRGPNTSDGPVGDITITKIKTEGMSAGFFGKDERGDMYLFKLDMPEYPELHSSAELIASKIYWALGYNVPETYITTITGTGDERYDGKRALASKFVTEEIRGFIRFIKCRRLREFRALKIAHAWVNNTDSKDLNSLTCWDEENQKAVFYLLDFNRSLGAATEGQKKPREGWENTFDFKNFCIDAGLLGVLWREKPYDENLKPFSPAVGLFNAEFDPRRWKTLRPNMAFEDITERDAIWIARKIAAFSDEQIRAIVHEAHYSNVEDEKYVADTLIKRRDIIAQTFLE